MVPDFENKYYKRLVLERFMLTGDLQEHAKKLAELAAGMPEVLQGACGGGGGRGYGVGSGGGGGKREGEVYDYHGSIIVICGGGAGMPEVLLGTPGTNGQPDPNCNYAGGGGGGRAREPMTNSDQTNEWGDIL